MKTLFGEIAVQKKFLTSETLDLALAEQEKLRKAGVEMFLGQILAKNGDLTLKQVSRILDIQKELLLGGITSTDVLSSTKGKKIVEYASSTATAKRLLPWVVAGVGLIMVVILGIKLLGVMKKAPEEKPTTVGKETQADITQLIAGIFTSETGVNEQRIRINELNRYPDAVAFPALQKVWTKTEPENHRQLVVLIQYLYGRNPEKTKTMLLEFIAGKETETLGYTSLFAIMNRLRNESAVWPSITAGLESNNPIIQEKALQCLALSDQPYLPELIEQLKRIVKKSDRPAMAALALRTLYSKNKYQDNNFILELLTGTNEKIVGEVLTLVFKTNKTELYTPIFQKTKGSALLLDLVVKSLRLYPSPDGEEFLLKTMQSTGGKDIKMSVIRSLAAYSSPQVVRALTAQFDKNESAVQAEANDALRTITKQDFGYRLGAPEKENRQAITAWKEYAKTYGKK